MIVFDRFLPFKDRGQTVKRTQSVRKSSLNAFERIVKKIHGILDVFGDLYYGPCFYLSPFSNANSFASGHLIAERIKIL